jgi:hypothetical protein
MNKNESAVKILSQAAEAAGKMVTASEELVTESTRLCNQSADALIAASQDNSITIEKRKEIEKCIHDLKAQEAKLKAKSTDLANDLKQAKTAEAAVEKKTDEARRKTWICMFSAFAKPFGEVAGALARLHPLGMIATAASASMTTTSGGSTTSTISQDVIYQLQQAQEAKKLARAELNKSEELLASKKQELKSLDLKKEKKKLKLEEGSEKKKRKLESEVD